MKPAPRCLERAYWEADESLALEQTSTASILRAAAERWPQKTALIDASNGLPPMPKNSTNDLSAERRTWTYAELLDISERTARTLLNHFEPGTHIAVWAANCPEWVVLQYGLALAGMVLVTVNPAYGAAELSYVLAQSKSQGIFFQKQYRSFDMAAAVELTIKEAQTALTLHVCLDDFSQFLSGSEQLDNALPEIAPTDPAMIQYTSGTTGQPKGALLNHYSVTNNARLMAVLKGQNEQTINLAVAPLFHTAGCVGNILGAVQTGGTLLLPNGFDAESMLDFIERDRVTYTFAVPTMLIALLNAQQANPRDLSSLKTVFSGGATVPMEVVRQIEEQFEVRLIIGYGQTETSPAITHTRFDDSPSDKSETIGQAIPQVEVKIIDVENGETLPVDQSGELCTRGFLVMMGYFENPTATAATIDDDGWLHTGDLCAMDSRGYFRITGRLKDMIIRGGENIYPREIEELLYTHPAISDVAVVGVPDDYWGEAVGAVITFKPDSTASSESLKSFARESLARHKVPSVWYTLKEIPTTASGKLQKFKLVDMIKSGELDDALISE
jgi:fatty-acyl-CoA synthase